MENANTPKLISIDLMRVVCIIGVIWYHCASHSNSEYKPFLCYANGDWGAVCVMVFFMISGAMLYYNYPKFYTLREVRFFYFKRWKSIFPAFYISYFLVFIMQAIHKRALFYNGKPWKIFISLIGMDGYFHYLDDTNYYLIGEWFLGAIIILYLLYPLLLVIFSRLPVIMPIICLSAYIWMNESGVFQIHPTQNLISCITFFVIGMLLIRYKSIWDNTVCGAFSLLVIAAMSLWKMGSYFNLNYMMTLFAIAFFVFLYEVGNYVMKCKVAKGISVLSRISYEMFLWQHLVILFILKRWNPISISGVWVMMILSVVGTAIMAYLTRAVTQRILHTRFFLWIESRVM